VFDPQHWGIIIKEILEKGYRADTFKGGLEKEVST
jgi:hypothetical protein